MTTPMTAPRWNYDLDLSGPLRWKKPRDLVEVPGLFDSYRSNDDIAAVFGVMAATPQHTYHVTSRRARSMAGWFDWIAKQGAELRSSVGETPTSQGGEIAAACAIFAGELGRGGVLTPDGWRCAMRSPWPLRNVFLGIYAENQEHAGEEIPHLLRYPAVVRVVNLMPLTGPVDLSRWLAREAWWCPHCKAGVELSEAAWHGFNNPASDAYCPTCDTALDAGCGGIGWVRVGGDVGGGAILCDVALVRDIIRQCRAAGVPVSVERLGARPVAHDPNDLGAEQLRAWEVECAGEPFPEWGVSIRLRSRNGSDPAEWPEDLRVRERPVVTP